MECSDISLKMKRTPLESCAHTTRSFQGKEDDHIKKNILEKDSRIIWVNRLTDLI